MGRANHVGRPVGGPSGAGSQPGGRPSIGGRYRLGARLGGGGEGEAYAATDEATGAACVVKLFGETTPADSRAADRVRAEFERLRALEHPGLVRALDVGREQGRLFLVTERVAGEAIASIADIADDARRLAAFAAAARDVTDALAYLHGRGVVHGDVSPANVRLAADGRAVLIDFGAAALRAATAEHGGAHGTLGFAAPEALIGRLTPASDLFSLGGTLFAAWTGAGPFGAGAAAVARMLAGAAPRVSDVRPGLPETWVELVASLLHAEPERRPASARSVLRQIARLVPDGTARAGEVLRAPFPAGDPLAGIFVGRTRERTVLRDALDRLAEGSCPHAVLAVVGAAGSGRATLLARALEDFAIAQVAEPALRVTTIGGSLQALVSWLGSGSGTEKTVAGSFSEGERDGADPIAHRERRFAAIAAALEARGALRPVAAVLTDGPDELAFATFVAGSQSAGRALILVPVLAPLARPGALDLRLGALGPDDVRSLVTRAIDGEPPPAALARVIGSGAGHAATAAVLTRQLVEAIRRGDADRFASADLADGGGVGGRGLEDLLRQSLSGLSAAAQRLIAGISLDVWRGVAGDAGARPALEEAEAAGWIVRGRDGAGDEIGLPSALHHAVVRRKLGEPALRDVARHALDVLELADGRRGVCFEALGQRDEAAAAYLAAGREKKFGGGVEVAAVDGRWLVEAARLAPAALEVEDRLALAGWLALAGRIQAALQVTEAGPSNDSGVPSAAPGAVDGGRRLRLAERRAWLLGRAGRADEAVRLLEEALVASPAPAAVGEARAAACARLARLLVSRGRYADAVAIADPIAADPVAGPLATEALLLARAYAGDLAGARALHAQLAARTLSAARASYLGALIAQLAGELGAALEGYRRALLEADAAGDIHTIAAISLNLAALSAEAGRYEEALATHERAIRELGRLGATAELASALFNAGMTLVELGDFEGVRRLVGRLRDEVLASGRRDSLIAFLEGEIALRQGDDAGAADRFAEAGGQAGEAAGEQAAQEAVTIAAVDPALRLAAEIARAESLGRLQKTADATAVVARLEAREARGDERSLGDLRLARARILLAAPVFDPDAGRRLAPLVEADGGAAVRAGRKPRGIRGALAAARLYQRAGQPAEATRALRAATALFEEVRMSTPIDHRARLAQNLDGDGDGRALADLLGGLGRGAGGDDGARAARAARSEERLRRLLRINKRLNSELRLPRLLELIMDTVIELTEAERGFLLLEDEHGELAVKIARNIDQQSLETGAFELSRSIARQAAAGGAPIVTIDAAGDPRFKEAVSVSDLHLRSVLAVPLQVKGRSVGTVYVDNRLRKGAFGDDDIQLVLDFSEQAGIAIENARLLSEVRKRERQIEVLNRRLEGELAARREELVGMKQELRENRQALAVRYDYRNIVGRTPRMLELFRLLDRLTDTQLPVVVQGESGTGKELVARALHFNGPRRDRPFVSENCAAIPETLLESTLFGAVRGAYTGADHDSRGLFEVADGGSLFLDEVGEMSPGMQGKLLRVLQTGELRRVGSERTRKVDVRIIAATNRDLGRLVEEGRFRQDLFFRLSVAAIVLPPLRERRDDIPSIVEHLLAKIASGGSGGVAAAPKTIEPAALARLCAYRWPGNVRELENELLRAAALCRDRITVSDLSPQVAGDAEAALTSVEDPDSLVLRPRVERLERALLREALSRTGGNQTRAAEALGLSRFGLQKKMRRYHMG